MLPDTCRDGMDCPHYHWCNENKHEDEPCFLEDRMPRHDVPLDKIITDD